MTALVHGGQVAPWTAALLVLAALALPSACRPARIPSEPSQPPRRAATAAAATPRLSPTRSPVPTFPARPTIAPSPSPTRVCASPEAYRGQAEYSGSFTFDVIATEGKSGAITETRIIIRTTPVEGPTGAVQFAFWFQGRGGGPEGPYINQLRLIATADCLDAGTGGGSARILPAPRPGDFLVPSRPFGESSAAGLDTADPYDFRLYLRQAGGSVPPEALPGEYGFVTGGWVMLSSFGPTPEGWRATGTISASIAVISGQAVPPFTGRFDVVRP